MLLSRYNRGVETGPFRFDLVNDFAAGMSQVVPLAHDLWGHVDLSYGSEEFVFLERLQ